MAGFSQPHAPWQVLSEKLVKLEGLYAALLGQLAAAGPHSLANDIRPHDQSAGAAAGAASAGVPHPDAAAPSADTTTTGCEPANAVGSHNLADAAASAPLPVAAGGAVPRAQGEMALGAAPAGAASTGLPRP